MPKTEPVDFVSVWQSQIDGRAAYAIRGMAGVNPRALMGTNISLNGQIVRVWGYQYDHGEYDPTGLDFTVIVLTPLADHNAERRAALQRPKPNGLACPKCGSELSDVRPPRFEVVIDHQTCAPRPAAGVSRGENEMATFAMTVPDYPCPSCRRRLTEWCRDGQSLISCAMCQRTWTLLFLRGGGFTWHERTGFVFTHP